MVARTLSKLIFASALGALIAGSALGQSGWLTRSFIPSRTSANQSEKLLTPKNVNATQFGLLFMRPLDGQVYAQPLVVPNVKIPNKGTFKVVYVATMHDSIYAYDADTPGNNQPLWQRSFIDPTKGITTIPSYDLTFEGDIHPEVGIVGTPVIDLTTNTMYVVVRTLEGDPNIDSNYHQRLYALDITTGANKIADPVELAAQVPGTGDGSSGGILSYNGRRQNQRPGLTLANGNIYIASASHGDQTPYHGWILAYSASTLKFVSAFCSTPNGYDGGFWMSGQGLCADGSGNLYGATGNGDFDNTKNEYGDSVLKLKGSNLSLLDYFTPYNQANLNNWDADLGSCGPILIPGTSYLVTGSKEGKLYVVNRGAMGKYNGTDDNRIPQWWGATNGIIFAPPAYWQGAVGGNLFVWSSYDTLKGFAFDGKVFGTTPYAASAATSPGSPGAGLTITSNGTDATSAIVWATVPYQGDANQNTVPGILRAFRASDLTELYNSRSVGGDDFGNFAKFNAPTVVFGKVYVPTFSNQLAVYGILPPVPPVPAQAIAAEGGTGVVAVTWKTSRGASSYDVLRGPIGGPYVLAANVAGSTLYVDTKVTNGQTYAYVVVAKNSYGKAANSNEVSAAPSAVTPVVGTGLSGYYYNDPADGSHFRNLFVRRLDKTINFDWGAGTYAPGGQTDNFSAIWFGMVTAPTTGYYQFQTSSDDGVRLWVRGALAIDGWRDQAPTFYNSSPILMVAGQQYPIRMEYYENGGGAVAQLNWMGPNDTGFSVVPTTALVPYTTQPLTDGPVDLAGVFNQDGMSYLSNPKDGDIGLLSQTLASELLPPAITFTSTPKLFTVGPKYDVANNVFQCDGSKITVPAFPAKLVSLAGFAINGSQTGTFQLNYSDGSSSTTSLSFTDWGHSTGSFKELPVLTMAKRHNPLGYLIASTTIYRYVLTTTGGKVLTSITTPNNPNMKVLSIYVNR